MKQLFGGIAVGVMAVFASQYGYKAYQARKEPRLNPWERAFNDAELLPYNNDWMLGSEPDGTIAGYFKNIPLQSTLTPMRVFKTFTPTGARALIVVTKYSDLMVIYEADAAKKIYRCVGHPAFMDKRIDNESVFINAVPHKYLIDACDPTSAVYDRPAFRAYYDFDPIEVKQAAHNDDMITDFLDALVSLVCSEGYTPDQGIRELPILVEAAFPHLSLNINVVDEMLSAETVRGLRQEDRAVKEILKRKLEDEIASGEATKDDAGTQE